MVGVSWGGGGVGGRLGRRGIKLVGKKKRTLIGWGNLNRSLGEEKGRNKRYNRYSRYNRYRPFWMEDCFISPRIINLSLASTMLLQKMASQ